MTQDENHQHEVAAAEPASRNSAAVDAAAVAVNPVRTLTDLERLRRMPWYVAASLANSVFCVLTFTGSVFILFLSELGFAKDRIGLLLALVPYAQVVALFVAGLLVRFGLKRGHLLFYGFRTSMFALVLLTPWVLGRYGQTAGFLWVTVVLVLFALGRGVAETAIWAWYQEMVPNRIRGKFGAINTIISTVGIVAAVMTAGYVVGHFSGLGRFMLLITIGVAGGILSLTFYAMVPGGAPAREANGATTFRAIRETCRDRKFLMFLAGFGLPCLALTGLLAFMPLYMKEKIGLASAQVIRLDVAFYLGAILTTYFWGWASDRYGSKPVIVVTVAISCLLPIAWYLLPRGHEWSVILAMSVALLAGCAYTGWWVTSNRYLFVRATPREGGAAYTAVFFAWWGVAAGSGPLLAGWLLEAGKALNGQWWILPFDGYTLLFAAGFIGLLSGVVVLGQIQPDSMLRTPTFVSIFFQGNPLQAFGSLVRHKYARDEWNRILTTERLGHARTLLSMDELIEALHDPSFNVRYEAIIAMAHLPKNRRVVDTLVSVLGEENSDLAPAAAWALGKVGDGSAMVPLREMLLSEFPLLRARCARSLAMLGDTDSRALLLEHLRDEEETLIVRVACGAALGSLRTTEATSDILRLLYECEDSGAREELALAAARTVSTEPHYIRLRRRLLEDLDTQAAQMLLNMRRALPSLGKAAGPLRDHVTRCAQAFAEGNFAQGLRLLVDFAREIPRERLSRHLAALLDEAIQRARQFGSERFEYVVLLFYATGRSLRYLHSLRGPHPGQPELNSLPLEPRGNNA